MVFKDCVVTSDPTVLNEVTYVTSEYDILILGPKSPICFS